MNLRYVALPEGAALILSWHAVETMTQFRQTSPNHKEAGGQLFGHFKGSDSSIVEATMPKWLDRRGRTEFRPNRWLQCLEIRNRYRKGLHYIGDWHTHPEKHPQPSIEDLLNMKECFDRSRHALHAFVLVIVGIDSPPEGLHISLITKDSVLSLFHEQKL